MPPKPPEPKKPSPATAESSLLEAFPLWSDAPADKDPPTGRYEDVAGLFLPTAAQPFCDCWKRSEELVQNTPDIPVVIVNMVQGEVDKKGKAPTVTFTRELTGKLYSGHDSFDWLLAIITTIITAEPAFPRGDYLWELIGPKDANGQPARSTFGKYRVKLWLLDAWRAVTVDDRIPVDLFGRPLFVGVRPLQLWPLLLCKAVLKVMAALKCLDLGLPNQVAALQMLTGWTQEDLLDPLTGCSAGSGALFDRLQDALGGPGCAFPRPQPAEAPAIASCCLIRRSKPERKPPRIIVLTGPSGVGRAALVNRLLTEYPDKFGATVSTTSRQPMAHEVDGKDYFFTTKLMLLSDARQGQFLEVARIRHRCPRRGTTDSYWYGTSLATVREVAATGKLCVASLDLQGVMALRNNKRVEGLYLYITTSTPQQLAARQAARLKEAESTLAARMAWADKQCAAARGAGLYDRVIVDTSLQEAYLALKEAISTLSPIIRNRLFGLPAYVLDYSDLIAPNSVEKPALKPVVVSGPDMKQRRALLLMLEKEFPDVFAFPRLTTTWPMNEDKMHKASDGDDATLPTSVSRRWATTPRGRLSGSDLRGLLGPTPVTVDEAEFDRLEEEGELFESHEDLFTHPLIVHKHGVSLTDVQAVVSKGKLPLLELEAEGVEALRKSKADCLTIFLQPPDLEVHEGRLRTYLTETEAEIAERTEQAAAERAAAIAAGVYDAEIVNDNHDEAYKQLCAAISKFRPDIIPPAEEVEAAEAAAAAAAAGGSMPHLVLCGPPGSGRSSMAQLLLTRFPDRVASPGRVTDRKPGKADKDTPELQFLKPEVLAKMVAGGQMVVVVPDAAGGTSTGVTTAALAECAAAGKMALLEVDTPAQLQQLLAKEAETGGAVLAKAFKVFVAKPGAAPPAAGAAGAPPAVANARGSTAGTRSSTGGVPDGAAVFAAMVQEAQGSGLFQAIITAAEDTTAVSQLQATLSAAHPGTIPPPLAPLVVVAPFGSGKRALLQALAARLPEVVRVPQLVTTKPRQPYDKPDVAVISEAEAAALRTSGGLLAAQTVMGHTYGIRAASVQQLQAEGRLALLDLDRVEQARGLKAAGFKALYLWLRPSSREELVGRLKAEVLAHPPPGYDDPAAAAAVAAGEVLAEVEAGEAAADTWDLVLDLEQGNLPATLGRLLELLQQQYPAAIAPSSVWGYGQPLWDAGRRVYGEHPLRLVLLGPAACGKSTQGALLAKRYGLVLVNAGDLLHAEIASGSVLGQEAKLHMDRSKTVPGRLLLALVVRRLGQPDCVAAGWLLDGFPHTQQQAAALTAAGHVPDKVLFFEGTHKLLMERAKWRRVDYATGAVFHLPEGPAASEPIQPLLPGGGVDVARLGRLAVRHDDSEDNVAHRLALWDKQVPGLRSAYADISLRVPAAGSPGAVAALCGAFVQLEADLAPGPAPQPSWQLEELAYQPLAVTKYKRQQLVLVRQTDGKTHWLGLKELAGNAFCLLLAHNPALLQASACVRRLDVGGAVPKQQLVQVESVEPVQLLVGLSMGPQHPLGLTSAPTRKVCCILGPRGAGKNVLAAQLLRDFPTKVTADPTTMMDEEVNDLDPPEKRPESGKVSFFYEEKHRKASAAAPLGDVNSTSDRGLPGLGGAAAAAAAAAEAAAVAGVAPSDEDRRGVLHPKDFNQLVTAGQLLAPHVDEDGSTIAYSLVGLEASWEQQVIPLVTGSWELGQQLMKELPGDVQVVVIFVDAPTVDLDQRMRSKGRLGEADLQAHLADAEVQRAACAAFMATQAAVRAGSEEVSAVVQQLLARVECYTVDNSGQLGHAYAAAKEVLAAHWHAAAPQLYGLLLVEPQPLRAPDGSLPAGGVSIQEEVELPETSTVVSDPAQGEAGESHKALSRTKAAGLGVPHAWLRLRATTAAGAMLELSRGRHLLRLLAPEHLVHTIRLSSRTPFSVGEASKVLPAAGCGHVLVQEGEHEAWLPGTYQVLFRYLLKPSEPCAVDLELRCSQPAAAACGRLVLVDLGDGSTTTHVSNRLLGCQLAPQDKGYLVVAWATPSSEVAPGAWALTATSSAPLPPLVEQPPGRVLAMEGAYSSNLAGVMSRFLVCPTSPVCLSLTAFLSQPQLGYRLQVLDLAGAKEPGWADPYPLLAAAGVEAGAADPTAKPPPGPAGASAAAAAAAATAAPAAAAPAAAAPAPAAAAAKGAAPGGKGPAGAAGAGAAGAAVAPPPPQQQLPVQPAARAVVPGVVLGPGRYLVQLQLEAASAKLVAAAAGAAAAAAGGADAGSMAAAAGAAAGSAPEGSKPGVAGVNWAVQMVSSLDEKACPITADDAWERHLRANLDAWQAAAAAAAAEGGPGSAPAATPATPGPPPKTPPGGKPPAPAAGGKAAAVDKDARARLAAAALERYLAAQQAAAGAVPDSVAAAAAAAPPPPASPAGGTRGAAPKGKAGAGKPGSAGSKGSAAAAAAAPAAQDPAPAAAAASATLPPGAVVRQLQSGATLQLHPPSHLARVTAAPGAAGGSPAATSTLAPSVGGSGSSTSSDQQPQVSRGVVQPGELSERAAAAAAKAAADADALARSQGSKDSRKATLQSLTALQAAKAADFSSRRAQLIAATRQAEQECQATLQQLAAAAAAAAAATAAGQEAAGHP